MNGDTCTRTVDVFHALTEQHSLLTQKCFIISSGKAQEEEEEEEEAQT